MTTVLFVRSGMGQMFIRLFIDRVRFRFIYLFIYLLADLLFIYVLFYFFK